VNGHAHLDVQGIGRLDFPSAGTTLTEGDKVSVAIRPEKLVLHDTAPVNGSKAIAGEIALTTYLGERSHYQVRVPGCDTPIAISTQNIRMHKPQEATIGRPVWLTWSDDALIVLER
ncbi:MAG: TOBE domain-containing protein, partial [Paracoccaceae bacterium]|nr:TOBE domain-containing protein [Paracoccaceae bacterium]